jgi:hypothetical protein
VALPSCSRGTQGDGGMARFGRLCFNKNDLEASVLMKEAVQHVELEKSNNNKKE